jgi:hypothetical protein
VLFGFDPARSDIAPSCGSSLQENAGWLNGGNDLSGFPRFPSSVIFIACFGKLFHQITIVAEARFREQKPFVQDGVLSAR